MDYINDEQTRINKAKYETALEIARNMLLEGMSIEDVTNITGLTVDDIKGLGIDPDAARRINELRQKKIWDDNSRINGAREEGKRLVAIDVANNMLNMEYSLEYIVEITGLSEEEVNQLK